MKWTEREIGRNLYWHTFARRHLVVIPNCQFPGSECDLLIVRNDLRLMDVEIKISRADLRADQHKEKWFKPWDFRTNGWRRPTIAERERVEHPAKIWKHYYALPAEIWSDELFADIPKASGVIILRDRQTQPWLSIKRQAKPNPTAVAISAHDVMQIARGCGARMWDAYAEIDEHRRGLEAKAAEASA